MAGRFVPGIRIVGTLFFLHCFTCWAVACCAKICWIVVEISTREALPPEHFLAVCFVRTMRRSECCDSEEKRVVGQVCEPQKWDRLTPNRCKFGLVDFSSSQRRSHDYINMIKHCLFIKCIPFPCFIFSLTHYILNFSPHTNPLPTSQIRSIILTTVLLTNLFAVCIYFQHGSCRDWEIF